MMSTWSPAGYAGLIALLVQSTEAVGSACTSSQTTPTPPPGGAVIWMPPGPGTSPINTLILDLDDPWPLAAVQCLTLLEQPTVVTVAPGGALVIKGLAADGQTEVITVWGAVSTASTTINLLPNGDNSMINGMQVLSPSEMVAQYGSCRACQFDGLTVTIPVPNENVAFFGDFSGASFRKATLTSVTGVIFDGADFTGATLKGNHYGASFRSAIVDGTVFDGADLSRAALDHLRFSSVPPSFRSPVLGQGTAITNTNLLDASFSGVQSSGGDLSFAGSQLSLATAAELLVGAKLTGVQWSGATVIASAADRKALAGADLTGLNLSGIQLLGEGVDLTGAHLDGATLTAANFSLVRLTGATLTNVGAAGASFADADLSANDDLAGASFAGAQTSLQKASFIDADISGASFQDADLSEAVFTGVRAVGTAFDGVKAPGAIFSQAHVYGNGLAFDQTSDLSNADFSDAVLAGDVSETGGFDFGGAPLAGAHFDNAICVACNFTGAHLDNATFTSAYLPGSTLTNATLTGASLDKAWLYCGSTANDWCSKVPNESAWAWPLALGTDEAYGPVPFATTNLTGATLTDVTACPDGKDGSIAPAGCQGHLLPRAGEAPPIPAACSASAHGACPTATGNVFDATSAGDPWAVVATSPPTWNTTLSGEGYYVALGNGTVQRVNNGGATLIAGSPGKSCPANTDACGDGGPATAALLGTPKGLAVGLDGSLYIADPVLLRVRRIDPSGVIATVAGTGAICASQAPGGCGDGGPATAATLAAANSVWVDTHGVFYIADGVRGLRRVNVDGTITTLNPPPVGTLTRFQAVVGDADGNLYATTQEPDHLVQISPATGTAAPVVGTGISGYNGTSDDDGLLPGTEVQVNGPEGLSVDLDGNILFVDSGNSLIRGYVPATGHVIELAGSVVNGIPQSGYNGNGHWAEDTVLAQPWSVAATRGALFVVADTGNQLVRQFGPNPVSAEGGRRQPEVLLSCRRGAVWACRRFPVSSASAAGRPVGAATIRGKGMVFAAGRRLVKVRGRLLFLLTEQRPLVPGRYQLSVKGGTGIGTQLIRIR